MEIIKTGIFLSDRNLAARLARGLAELSRAMEFTILDVMDKLDEFDLVLTERPVDFSKSVLLCRRFEEENLYNAPPYKLCIYKDSSSFVNDLLFVYFKMTNRVLEYRGNGHLQVIGCVSPEGGCGTTLTSISVSRMLNHIYGSRVLYLNLCPINDSCKYLVSGREERFLKLLYYLERGKDFPLESFITSGMDLDYIETSLLNSHAEDLRMELANELLKKLELLGRYDYLALDLGNHLNRQNRSLLEHADFLLYVHRDKAEGCQSYFVRLMEEILQRASGTRILKVTNFADDRWQEAEEDRLCLSQAEDAGNLERESNYTMEIARIAKWIVED